MAILPQAALRKRLKEVKQRVGSQQFPSGSRWTLLGWLLGLSIGVGSCGTTTAQDRFRFDFGTENAAAGFTAVTPDLIYSAQKGYGFEPGAQLQVLSHTGSDLTRNDGVTAEGLFKFSVAVPEGNYRVTVTLGDAEVPTVTTVKAEARRLMLESVRTAAGQFETKSFIVSIRSTKISTGGEVLLNTFFENTANGLIAHWDDKLTLQFSDSKPVVCAVEIERVTTPITTVFLMGDSTVTDQAREPNGTWGMYLSRWFGPDVVIANYAESGETLKAFRRQHRWEKILSQLRPGDYVFMQFGHNDLNKTGHDAVWPGPEGEWSTTHSPAETDYKQHLKEYAAEAKAKGAIPVIVSPMTKLNIGTGELNIAGMQQYPRCAVEAAQEAGIACIDLNAMSVELWTVLGPDKAKLAYVDGLHTNSYGGYILSRSVVSAIEKSGLELAKHLLPEARGFEIKNPHPTPEEFTLPLEPRPPGRGRRGAGRNANPNPMPPANPAPRGGT